MRILQLSDSYPPAPGGLEQVVQRLANELADRGHESAVATLAREGLPEVSDEGSVRVHRLRGWTHKLARFAESDDHLLHPTAPDPPLVRRLQELIDQWQPDIIHAHGWIVSSASALRLGPDTRLVTSLHDYGLVCAKKTLIHLDELDAQCAGPSLGRCVRCASNFYGVAKGTALASGLREGRHRLSKVSQFLPITAAVGAASAAAAEPERSTVVPPFVADDILAERTRPRPPGLPEGDFILFVGALSAHKGADLLIQAHRELASQVPLVLIGHGDPAPWRVLAGTADVRVLQHVPNEQIQGAMQAATLVVMPSRWAEPFGLVAIEAMAAGTALVASKIGSLPEIVGDAGLVVEPKPAEMAAAIDSLLADPARRELLGNAGKRRATWFTASAVVPRYLAAYEAAKRSGTT
ncbi:MAG TPA: glycosyltransferase family 4 protein [Aeromicrobium sp.]|nr:glycosyltransferase family 4 protein [Aeromicrobium sp.]